MQRKTFLRTLLLTVALGAFGVRTHAADTSGTLAGSSVVASLRTTAPYAADRDACARPAADAGQTKSRADTTPHDNN